MDIEKAFKQEFDHKEAFALMEYQCESCQKKRIVWNTRDGVTPFMILCKDCHEGIMQHVNFHNDRFAPEHKLSIGDWVFMDMTEDEYRDIQKRKCERFWESNVHDCRDRYESLDDMIEKISTDFKERSPILKVVETKEIDYPPPPKYTCSECGAKFDYIGSNKDPKCWRCEPVEGVGDDEKE